MAYLAGLSALGHLTHSPSLIDCCIDPICVIRWRSSSLLASSGGHIRAYRSLSFTTLNVIVYVKMIRYLLLHCVLYPDYYLCTSAQERIRLLSKLEQPQEAAHRRGYHLLYHTYPLIVEMKYLEMISYVRALQYWCALVCVCMYACKSLCLPMPLGFRLASFSALSLASLFVLSLISCLFLLCLADPDTFLSAAETILETNDGDGIDGNDEWS